MEQTVCGKCGSPVLRGDWMVYAWSGGRVRRHSCPLCGWDVHEPSSGPGLRSELALPWRTDRALTREPDSPDALARPRRIGARRAGAAL